MKVRSRDVKDVIPGAIRRAATSAFLAVAVLAVAATGACASHPAQPAPSASASASPLTLDVAGEAEWPIDAPAGVVDLVLAGNLMLGDIYQPGAAHGVELTPGNALTQSRYDGESAVEALLVATGLQGQLEPGRGKWVTVETCEEQESYLVVAGGAFGVFGADAKMRWLAWIVPAPDNTGCTEQHPVGSWNPKEQ